MKNFYFGLPNILSVIVLAFFSVNILSCADAGNVPITGVVGDTYNGVNYIVSTKSIVNIYDTASEESSVVQQVEYGNLVNAKIIEGTIWAKIYKDREVLGYIKSEYIQEKKMHNVGGKYSEYRFFDYTKITYYLVFIIYIITLLVTFRVLGGSLFSDFIKGILFPLIVFVYFKYTGDPLWLCRPSIVGWFFGVVNFIVICMTAGQMLGMAISGIKSIMNILYAPIHTLIMLAMGAISALAFMAIFAEVIVEFTWIIIALIAMAGGSSRTFMGTFTDTSGNTYDVYS